MTGNLFGIAGWKNSGKTSLVSSLVDDITSRGLTVSTVKHAHHSFDLDQAGTDSFKHREAGAHEVALVSGKRWAIQHEIKDKPEPTLFEIVGKLSPCDVVLVEGYKREPIPKLEILASSNVSDAPLWVTDNTIVAVASDEKIQACPLPQFSRNQNREIADFILQHLAITC